MKSLKTPMQTLKSKILLTTGFTILAICFNNCSMGDAYQSQNNLSSSGVLSLTPTTVNLTAGQTIAFQATGGSGTYNYYLYGGAGSITTAGVYTAPVAMETDTVQVVDSQGNQAFASVVIGTSSSIGTTAGTLTISPSTLSVATNSSTGFSASGGTGNYVFSLYGGGGTITSIGYFTAPSAAGTSYIQVTDSGGGTAYATITVTASSATPDVEIYSYSSSSPGDHVYSTSSGGVSGYSYVKPAFKVFSTNVNSGSVALYSCHRSSNGLHFLSTDLLCAGQVNESTLGYFYLYPTSGFVPLYGYGSSNSVDTIDTVTPADGTSLSYYYEGILGYVGAP